MNIIFSKAIFLFLAIPSFSAGAMIKVSAAQALIDLVVPYAGAALLIYLCVWVERDARARGLESSLWWMLLVIFTNFLGLAIYLIARPKGNLIECPHCGKRRLGMGARCLYCPSSENSIQKETLPASEFQ